MSPPSSPVAPVAPLAPLTPSPCFWVGKYDESKYQNCLRIKKYFESEGQGTIGQKLFSAGFKKKNGYYNSKFQ